jgi:hypothetical protein
MGDAASAMAALQPEGEVAVAVGVEAHAEALEVEHARRRLRAQDLGGGGVHGAAAGSDRVLQVALRRVVEGDRRGQPPCAQ